MSQYFQVTKIVKSLITCLDFVQACFYIIKLFFVEFLSIYGIFLLSQKDQSLNPKFSGSGSSDFSELTVAGRPGRSTGRAQTCTPVCTGERSTVPVDRFRESALWKFRSTASVDRQRSNSLLQVRGRPGRSTGGSNGRILDRWRSTGSTDRAQRSDFSGLYKRGFCHCFELRF